MNKFEENECVYLRCKVTAAPSENQRLYRLTTVSDHAVVWAEEDEMLKSEKYPELMGEDYEEPDRKAK